MSWSLGGTHAPSAGPLEGVNRTEARWGRLLAVEAPERPATIASDSVMCDFDSHQARSGGNLRLLWSRLARFVRWERLREHSGFSYPVKFPVTSTATTHRRALSSGTANFDIEASSTSPWRPSSRHLARGPGEPNDPGGTAARRDRSSLHRALRRAGLQWLESFDVSLSSAVAKGRHRG